MPHNVQYDFFLLFCAYFVVYPARCFCWYLTRCKLFIETTWWIWTFSSNKSICDSAFHCLCKVPWLNILQPDTRENLNNLTGNHATKFFSYMCPASCCFRGSSHCGSIMHHAKKKQISTAGTERKSLKSIRI